MDMLKMVIVGSYGHVNYAAYSSALGKTVQIIGIAPWGTDDELRFLKDERFTQGEVPVWDDWRRMLAEAGADLAAVCTPMHMLAKVSTAAAEAGLCVFSEKPLATDLPSLDALWTAVHRSGVEVAAMLNFRGDPRIRAIRQAVETGRLGEIVLAFGQKSYPFAKRDEIHRKRSTYGGSIPWSAIHAIDWIRFTAGQDYTRVAAMHSNAAHPTHAEMEDNGGILFSLAGGGHAMISFDYARPWPGEQGRPWGDDRLRLVGSLATAEMTSDPPGAILLTQNGREDLPLDEPLDLLESFAASIRNEGRCLISTPESFRATEVALRARQAADELTVLDL